MEKEIISPEDFIKFFESTAGLRFVDADSGRPALEIIKENESKEDKSDYDLWLEQQEESVQQEHKMGAL